MQYNKKYDIMPYTVYHFDTLNSTADMAKDTAFENDDRYIILTDNQHAGRGRLGNNWHSSMGNLMCNMVQTLDMPLHRWSEISLVASLAISDVISQLILDTHTVQIKWPNDILINGAKIAGILLETLHVQTPTPRISLGIGINVVSSPAVERYQTCCIHGLGGTTTATDILPMIVSRFTQWTQSWQQHGTATIVSLWVPRAYGMGKYIKVRTPTTEISGVFIGVADTGELLLQTTNGVIPINAGEVVFG